MEKLNQTITAIVLTRNESKRIADCLDHLAWVDEILVIDNGSTDNTLEIVKKYKAKVIKSGGKNFSNLRNLAKAEAKNKWLLYVDADELVIPELKKEIQSVINQPDSQMGFSFKRKNYYLGHLWPYQDQLVRLMRADKLQRWEGRVHETAIIDGDIGTLKEPLIHNSHRTLEEMVSKTNEWSDIEALLRLEANHPKISWWRLIRVMFTGFIDSYIKQQGWKAGVYGLIESIYQAFSLFITYAKLWELQKDKK